MLSRLILDGRASLDPLHTLDGFFIVKAPGTPREVLGLAHRRIRVISGLLVAIERQFICSVASGCPCARHRGVLRAARVAGQAAEPIDTRDQEGYW